MVNLKTGKKSITANCQSTFYILLVVHGSRTPKPSGPSDKSIFNTADVLP